MSGLEPPAPARPRQRRSSSVISYMQHPPPYHHLQHLIDDPSNPRNDVPTPLPTPDSPRPCKRSKAASEVYGPRALRWVTNPRESFLIIAGIISCWCAWEIATKPADGAPRPGNPFDPFLFVSYDLPHRADDPEGFVRCRKGWLDLVYLPFFIILFSFIRQGLTQWIVEPFGKYIGISKGRKMERFMEQGYAVVYFGFSSVAGVYVMSHQATWWYRCEYFWLDYPEWDMPRAVKTYYLTQFAYWLQQALVMIAGLEKPRDDYLELVIHHFITLWLIGTSYVVNLTQIGVAVFVSMDIPDLFLAVSKCINYAGLERTGNVSFVIFLFTWGYLRHYENLRMLYSVWTQFDLIPEAARRFSPSEGLYMAPWVRYQIFLPILALQLVIAFWSFLILRIVFRMFRGNSASDVREENEAGTETDGGGSEMESKSVTRGKREARKRK